MELSVKQVAVNQLLPHPQNVRKGNIGAIKESLEAHGQYRPVVVQKSTNHIIAGNHTWFAARDLGWDKVAATFIDVSDEQAVKIMLVDNRTNELAINDETALLDLLSSLNDIAGSGYDDEDVADLMFKVEGTLGTTSEALSSNERLEQYEALGTKSITLPYAKEDYEQIYILMVRLREKRNIATNSDLVAALVREATND